MVLFFEMTRRAFRRYLTYRAATLAGFATNFFFGLVRIAIFQALYGQREVVAGITLQGAVTYVVLGQALIAFLSIFSWFELMRSVYTGEIAADLLKPVGLFSFWLAQDLGRALTGLLLRGVIFLGLFALLYDLAFPASPGQWLAVGLALVLGWLVGFAWRFLINLSAFWTPNAVGFLRFAFVFMWFFSGFLMPLRFFPDWVVRLSAWTPFPYMFNVVIDVYLGVVTGPEVARALAMQALWAAGLVVACQLVLRLGVKRLVILGG